MEQERSAKRLKRLSGTLEKGWRFIEIEGRAASLPCQTCPPLSPFSQVMDPSMPH